MAMENCKAAINAAATRELSEREIATVARHARFLKDKIDRANGPDEVAKVLEDFGNGIIAKHQIQKRNTALNYRALMAQTEKRRNIDFMRKNPAEALKGLFRGSVFDYQGSKNSLANLVDRETAARVGAFVADLEKQKLGTYAFAGADDLNIGKALWAIRNGSDPMQFGSEAAAVAKIMDKHQEGLRLDLNGAGAWISRNSDYIARQSHDSYKIARAGGNDFGSDAAFNSWLESLRGLDWEKSFDGDLASASVKERTDRLRSLFNQFASGKHLKFSGPEEKAPIPARGFQNIGGKVSHERQLVFQTPEDFIAYERNFGHGDSLAQSVFGTLNSGGRDLAIMKEWGPNARQQIERFHEEWQADLNKENRGADMSALNKAFAHEMKTTWPNITDEVGHPASRNAAKFLAGLRSTLNAARLGMSIFSSLGDLPLRASMLNMYGSRKSGEFFAELRNAVTGMVSGEGLSPLERQNLAAEMGIRMESMNLPLHPQQSDSMGFGKLAKVNQLVMKYALHSWWSNRLRTNALVADGFRHWTYRGREFVGLPEGMQALFRQFGIDQKGWDIIRSQEPDHIAGRDVFSPVAVQEIDPERFASLVTTASPTDAQLIRARDDLAAKYRNLMGEMADRITVAPSRANRAVMNQGLQAGTASGELLRGFMQLKGFTILYMQKHMGRELLGYEPDKVGISRALWRTLTFQPGARSARMGLVKLIASGVLTGYIGNTLRDIASGKTPEDPTGDHWGDAMKRAFARQSFGLYSDFLLGEHKQGATFWDHVGDMVGPEWDTVADLYDLGDRIARHATKAGGYSEDDFYKDAQATLGTAYRNTPGNNLFWTKFVTDWLVLNNLSEMLNPGFQRRMMERAQKERGQQYLFGAGPQSVQ